MIRSKKILRGVWLVAAFWIFLPTPDAFSRYPAPLFSEPVQVDSSGRPQYNQRQIQEINRQRRAKLRQERNQVNNVPQDGGGAYDKKSSGAIPNYEPVPIPSDFIPGGPQPIDIL